MMDENILSGAVRAIDEALADMQQRPPAPTREPESVVITPIDAHIAEMHDAMLAHNEDIAAAQTRYADRVNASRTKLQGAQNELRAAERELAARWHGKSGT